MFHGIKHIVCVQHNIAVLWLEWSLMKSSVVAKALLVLLTNLRLVSGVCGS